MGGSGTGVREAENIAHAPGSESTLPGMTAMWLRCLELKRSLRGLQRLLRARTEGRNPFPGSSQMTLLFPDVITLHLQPQGW